MTSSHAGLPHNPEVASALGLSEVDPEVCETRVTVDRVGDVQASVEVVRTTGDPVITFHART